MWAGSQSFPVVRLLIGASFMALVIAGGAWLFFPQGTAVPGVLGSGVQKLLLHGAAAGRSANSNNKAAAFPADARRGAPEAGRRSSSIVVGQLERLPFGSSSDGVGGAGGGGLLSKEEEDGGRQVLRGSTTRLPETIAELDREIATQEKDAKVANTLRELERASFWRALLAAQRELEISVEEEEGAARRRSSAEVQNLDLLFSIPGVGEALRPPAWPKKGPASGWLKDQVVGARDKSLGDWVAEDMVRTAAQAAVAEEPSSSSSSPPPSEAVVEPLGTDHNGAAASGRQQPALGVAAEKKTSRMVVGTGDGLEERRRRFQVKVAALARHEIEDTSQYMELMRNVDAARTSLLASRRQAMAKLPLGSKWKEAEASSSAEEGESSRAAALASLPTVEEEQVVSS